MQKPPKELVAQVEIIDSAIVSVNELIDNRKIKIENYGKDFIEPLTRIRAKAMELRNDLEIFKHDMERALTEQYYSSDRFAGEASKISTKSVVDKFLSSKNDF